MYGSAVVRMDEEQQAAASGDVPLQHAGGQETTALVGPAANATKTTFYAYALLTLFAVASVAIGASTLAKVLQMQSSSPPSSSCYPPAPSFTSAVSESTGQQTSSFTGAPPNILIAYHSVSGGVAQLVNFTAGGALQCCNTSVMIVDVATLDPNNTNATTDLLKSADGLILGSGVYNGDMHPIMMNWLLSWPPRLDLSWTVGDALCTSGGYVSGAQPTLYSLQRAMQTFSVMYAGGTSWRTGTGACAIVEGSDGAVDMQNVEEVAKDAQYLGYRVAMLASHMKVAKAAVREANQDPFDYSNPDKVDIQWPPRVVAV